jgi:hypothetical protein
MKLDYVCAYGAEIPYISVVNADEGQSLFDIENPSQDVENLIADMVESYNHCRRLIFKPT